MDIIGNKIKAILAFVVHIISLAPLVVIPWIVWNVMPEAPLAGKVSICVIAIDMFYGTLIGFTEG